MRVRSVTLPVVHLAQPPSAFIGRPPLVVDCSVLCAVLFEEEAREEALRVMAGRTLHAPMLLATEIASVALQKSRAGWPSAIIEDALSDYRQQAIEHHRPDVQAQCALALRHGLSAYDAAYLWVAGVLQAPLATFDEKLAQAARTHLAGPG